MDRRKDRKGRAAPLTQRLVIAGAPDRHAAEAISLELRRLAGRHGVAVTVVRIEPLDSEGGDSPP